MNEQRKTEIKELPLPKFTALSDGYEVVSNDGTIKVVLRRVTVMDNAMESTFYSTIMWVVEDDGWEQVSNTESYRTKEDFVKKLAEVDEFSQAYKELCAFLH